MDSVTLSFTTLRAAMAKENFVLLSILLYEIQATTSYFILVLTLSAQGIECKSHRVALYLENN
jgi:hypothetical protein